MDFIDHPFDSLDEIRKKTREIIGDFSEEDEELFDAILKACSLGTYRLTFLVTKGTTTKSISYYYTTENRGSDCYFKISQEKGIHRFSIFICTLDGYRGIPVCKKSFKPEKTSYYEKRTWVQKTMEMEKQFLEQKAYIERLEAQVKDMREHIESTPGGEFFLEAMEDFLNRKYSLGPVKQ